MPNQLNITADQALATQRADLRGVVYLLSGTLPPNVKSGEETFYWSTHTLSGLSQNWDAMLGGPVTIQREASFDPRTTPSSPGVRIPIRNLPFAHSDSLLAVLVDDDLQWEGTTATLRVGYLKPGQAPGDLADADWTPLVLDGFLGAPQDITLDGFSVVLYNRGAKRNQVVEQRLIEVPGGSGSSRGIDKADVGTPYPVVVGRPDSWFKPPTVDMVTRGFLVSGLASGATTIQIRPLTSGVDLMKSSGGSNTTRVMIDNRTPAYLLTTSFGDVVYDVDTNLLTFEIQSGLERDVPAGGYVQEYKSNGYKWALANYKLLTSGVDLTGSVGFRTPDGKVTTVELDRWPFVVETPTDSPDAAFDDNLVTHLRLPGGTTGDPNVPVLFVPLAAGGTPASVSVQPVHSASGGASDRLGSKLTFPTTATGGITPLNMVDGNQNTKGQQNNGVTATITFGVSAPSPFANTDTEASTLWAVIQGSPLFRNNLLTTTFGSFSVGTGTNIQVRMTLATPEDYNTTVKVTGNGGTSFVTDIWWEHDLVKTASISVARDTDVEVTGGGGGTGLELMEFGDLVFRMPKNISGGVLLEKVISGGSLVTSPWLLTENTGVAGQPVSHPSAAFAGLQGLFLGEDGALETIAQDSYDAAHARFQTENIRWNFVLLEQLRSWTDLEQQLAAQSRTDFYYGPSGHEMVFQDSVSGLASATPLQDFTLEGAPGANAVQGTGPLISRTGISEIRNTVEVDFAPDYAEGGVFQNSLTKTDAGSVTRMGTRKDPSGRFSFWAHSADTGNANYDVDASVGAIAQHMAERFASARMRYNFRTAWVAFGLDRGSLVTVSYKVDEKQFRTHRCEVESVRTLPLADETVELVCRSVGASPVQGLGPAVSGLEASVDFDGTVNSVLRTAESTVGIADDWSLAVWYKPDDVYLTINTQNIIRLTPDTGSANEISLLMQAGSGPPQMKILVRNSIDVLLKSFIVGNDLLVNEWNLIVMTFDGTTTNVLEVYVNGIDALPVRNTDGTSAMTDTARRIGLGCLPVGTLDANASGTFYTFGIWDSVLTSGEQLALYNGRNGVGAQFDTPIGDYASQANLQHWYRPGFDLANIGKDYGVGTAKPLLLSGAFMHAGRIGRDAPTWL